MHAPVDRPLLLGELLAETVRLYGERVAAALALGAVYNGLLLAAGHVHPVAYYAVGSLAFAASYAAASRLASGDGFAEAWAQVGIRLPLVLVLSFVVALPVLVVSRYLLLVLLNAAWLALTGFSIPVAMLEREQGPRGWFARLAYAVERSVALARAAYLHALGVAAALFLVNILVGTVLRAALVGFADNGTLLALFLAQVVLAPFFFLGLAVLYLEQRARLAESSAAR